MLLDFSKLEDVKHRGGYTVARCPACAEDGGDNKGEHLFINSEGAFGCVLFPSEEGKAHRKRILELVGLKKETPIAFAVHKAERK